MILILKKWLSVAYVYGIALTLTIGCAGSNQKTMLFHRQHDVQVIVKTIENCPSWVDTKGSQVELRHSIVSNLRAVTKFDAETVRAAEVLFLASPSGASFSSEAKLFLLHRLLFKVPRRVEGVLARKFGGWEVPSDTEGYDMLWPLRETQDGQLVLEGEYLGYMGPQYDPLAEFDFLNRTFGMRTPRSE